MSISGNLSQSHVTLSTRNEKLLSDHVDVMKSAEINLRGRVTSLWGSAYAESLWETFARIQNLSNEFESYVQLYGNDRGTESLLSKKEKESSEIFTRMESCRSLADFYTQENRRMHSSEAQIYLQEENAHLPEDSRMTSLWVDGKHNKQRNRSFRFSFRGLAKSLKQ